MKKKFLAVVITSAMVAGALPGVATAAEDNSGIQTVQNTEDIQEDTQQKLEAAIAQGGEIDLTGQTIELNSALVVNNDVVIKGGTLAGTDNVTGNLVTLMGSKVTLEGVTIRTSAANKSAIHAYGTSLNVNGLTIDHSSAAGGAPVIISNGAEASFRGEVNLTPGSHSWYGINVDNAKADFSGAVVNMTPVTDTQSVICSEGDLASVTGIGLTVVVTEKDGGAAHRQRAYVADSNLAQFVKAKTEAGADVSLIELNKDVTLTAPLFISEAMTVRSASGRHTINGSAAIGADNVVTVTAEGAALENVAIKTMAANKSPLHIYRVSAKLRNVTLDNQETAGGAGMIVNGGTVTVEGELNLVLGNNSWGGINVDTTNGAAGVTFADGSSVKMAGSDQDVIYIDEDNDAGQMTIVGAEEAGLAQDADGNYVIAGQDPAPGQPGDGDDGTNPDDGDTPSDGTPADDTDDKPVKDDGTSDGKTPDHNGTPDGKEDAMKKAPQTGDNSTGLYLALAALLGSGTAAGAALRKRGRRVK